MKILLLSRYANLGASSRVRFYQYIPFFEAHGIEVTVSPLFDDDYLRAFYSTGRKPLQIVVQSYAKRIASLLTHKGYDLIWLEKELFPFLPAWGEAILQALSIPYVVDYDDAIFHNYDMHRSRIVRHILGNKIDAVMHKAALVIAGNSYLADRARSAGAKHVVIMPSAIDLDRYILQKKDDSSEFIIGWIGSPSTTRYLKLIESALNRLTLHCNFRLVLVGAMNIIMDNVPLSLQSWSENSEVSDISSFDIGIMPLTDNPWERGKCGFKLIQYMACGLPVVASPVGVNREIVEDGVTGYLAKTDDDWLNAFLSLQKDSLKRKSMGAAGRRKVEQQYSLQVIAPRYCELLHAVAGKSK